MAASKPTVTTPVQKNIAARHRASCALTEGKKRCTCSPAYLVKIGVGPRGKQSRTTRTFTSLSDAQRWLLDNAFADASSGDASLQVLLRRLQDKLRSGAHRDKRGKVYKPSTVEEYCASIDLLSAEFPEVLRRPVDVLLRSDIQQMVDMLAATRSPQRVRNIMNPVRIVLGDAARDGLIRANPIADIRWPAKAEVLRRVVDFESDEAMIDRLDPPLKVLYALALYAGLRRGEAMGLRWRNVELDVGVLRVAEAFTHNEFTTPKSSASRREVPIGGKLLRILIDWKATCGKRGDDYVDGSALVLAGDDSPHRPIAESTIRRQAERQGAPTRLHSLRHSFATMLERSGVGLKEAQLILGHSDAMLTMNVYQHASVGMLDRIRDRIDSGFGTDLRLGHDEAEGEAWEVWQESLNTENAFLQASAEVNGGGFTPRISPQFDF